MLHKVGFTSLDELTKLREKILSYKNDPFAPKRGSSRLLFCLHCRNVCTENEVKWDSESGIWMCKNFPECTGGGVGFDLIPMDEMPSGGSGFQTELI